MSRGDLFAAEYPFELLHKWSFWYLFYIYDATASEGKSCYARAKTMEEIPPTQVQ